MASIADIARPARAGRNAWRWFWRGVANWMPKGLFARSLLIIIVPIVLLQAVVAFVFMERHWQQVTARLSQAVTQEIRSIIDVYENFPQDPDNEALTRIAADDFGLSISFLPPDPLPPAGPKPFFSLLDRTLSEEITRQIGRPFWIDTVGKSNLVEIRIKLDDAVLRVFARRSQAYASNSHIFIVWMIGTSLVLLAVAVAFLRNQIRPILRLAEAAETFGKGRDVEDFRPRGAREVRQAALAFLEMKRRIERQMEQRTTMLAGVSHDLRTILTRFKLELALLGDSDEIEMMTADVDEMQRMLEEYMAFARGDSGEQSEPVDVPALFETLKFEAERSGHKALVSYSGEPMITARPQAFKRCLGNLVDNACRFGNEVRISGVRGDMWLTVMIDDDGPGIPEPLREAVFKPFYRLEDSRNRDSGGTGLGLAIARDVVRSHGGEISLGESQQGGLRVVIRMPV